MLRRLPHNFLHLMEPERPSIVRSTISPRLSHVCRTATENFELTFHVYGQDISGDPDEGMGLGVILKPELVRPLIDTLPLEERLASYLPEGTLDNILDVLQSASFDSFTYVLRAGQVDMSQFRIDPSKYE